MCCALKFKSIIYIFRQEKYILKLGVLPISKLLAGVMVVIGVVIIVLSVLGKTQKTQELKEKGVKN